MNHEPRLWQYEGIWRIQDYRQLTDPNGVVSDAWESRRDENGVLFFETEEQAAVYRDGTKKAEKE